MSTLIHLFLDLENVQPTAAELELIRGRHFRLWVLHGPHQKDFTADRVCAWQPLGTQVQFVQSKKSGKNALDLHIAFCVGEASELDRKRGAAACYVIVSRDKDFDAMFGYLIDRKLRVGRADSLPAALKLASELIGKSLPDAKPKSAPKPKSMAKVQSASLSEYAARVLKDLRDHPRTRPRTEKKLHNHIASFLGHEIEGQALTRLVSELKAQAGVKIEGTKVTYNL
jgi:hypothetical protein